MSHSFGRALVNVTAGCLLLASLLAATVSAQPAPDLFVKHSGDWLGTLALPGARSLRVGISLFQRADGSAGGAYAQPDQASFGTPLHDLRTDGESLLANGPNGLRIALRPVADTLVADLSFGNQRFSTTLLRKPGFDALPRPQTPRADPTAPYREREIAFDAEDGTTLAGTLSLPSTPGPHLAVVLIGGSGPTDRHASHSSGHQPFAVLADILARQGVIVLRYDKRGVMRSAGDYRRNTQASMVADVRAAVRAVRRHTPAQSLGLIGHSEGGIVAAQAAIEAPEEVQFVAALGSPVLSGRDSLLMQDRVGLSARGVPDKEAAVVLQFAERFYDQVIAISDSVERFRALEHLHTTLSAEEGSLIRRHAGSWVTLKPAWGALPQARDLLRRDYGSLWASVQQPLLALFGERDVQVPPMAHLAALVSHRGSASMRTQVVTIDGVNHMMQPSRTGLEEEYRGIDETIAPEVLRVLCRYVVSQGPVKDKDRDR